MKNLKIIASCLAFIAVIISLIFMNPINNDSKKFKEEYESLNKTHKPITINKNNPIKYADYDEIVNLIKSGTGVIYFGFPECPWCRNAVPVLLEAAEELELKEIYYFNALDMRDIKKLDENGKIVTTKEGTKEYYELVNLLSDYLGEYEGLNDKEIKRLYFPTVVFVKEGKVLGLNVSTVESQLDPMVDLNEKQKAELKNIYETYMSQVLGITCPITGNAC